MDIIPAVGRKRKFVRLEDIEAVSVWRNSGRFSEKDRTVIEFAEVMSDTPVRMTSELSKRVKMHFDDDQIVELTASIAFENYRARFNHALEMKSEQFLELEKE